MRRILVVFLILSLALIASPVLAKTAKKKKKRKKGDEPPPVGKVMVGEFPCYAPPNFGAMNAGQRREARSLAWAYLEGLVSGKLVEGFKIEDQEDFDYFETAFLGRPQLLDSWLGDNFARCKAVGEGKEKASSYLAYLGRVGGEFEADECYKPLDYEYHNFLDIQDGWQSRVHICQGDQVLIEGTEEMNGKYTISDTGNPRKNLYITAAGDPNVAEAGEKGLVPELPLGALVMKFEAEDGSYTKFFMIGHRAEFKAADHGFLYFSVNDTTYYDNVFHGLGGAVDFLGIDIYPAVGGGGN